MTPVLALSASISDLGFTIWGYEGDYTVRKRQQTVEWGLSSFIWFPLHVTGKLVLFLWVSFISLCNTIRI